MKKGLSVIGLSMLLAATPLLMTQAQEKGADQLAVEGLSKTFSYSLLNPFNELSYFSNYNAEIRTKGSKYENYLKTK